MSADKAVVRMYNVGFGDCFLLTLPTTAGPRRVLIDCGTHPSSTGPRRARRDAMHDLFKDLEREAGALRIDVVVASHRHKDHIEAFADKAWARVEVGEVWMPWTENPDEEEATAIRERMKLAMNGLLGARKRLENVAEARGLGPEFSQRLEVASSLIDNNVDFVDDDTAEALSLAIRNEGSMETLWSGFAGNAKRDYLSVRSQPLETPLLPGVRVHVLGPSRDESVLRDLEPPKSETFAHVDQPVPVAEAAGLPFDEGWAKSSTEWGSEADTPEFAHLLVSDELKGTISQLAADDILAAAASIESSINGTSLMLIFEVGGLFLFFPGDAQWGTWNMVLKNPQARSLLGKVAFYKIGHHGSHNATPRSFIKDVMAANALAAIPVASVARWPRIPLDELVAEMTGQKQIRLVRSDDPQAGMPIANVKVNADISVDFEFDLPNAPIALASAPAESAKPARRARPTGNARRNGGRKKPAKAPS
jgi:beta-lactamase superfamily II metal-dependent hydrolase